ncbi:cobaltochelatase subunit CobN [Methanopyrus sp.]
MLLFVVIPLIQVLDLGPISAAEVTILSSTPLPNAEEVGRELGVSVHVHYIPKDPTSVGSLDWEKISEDVQSADVLVIQRMGTIPAAFTRELSKRVLGTALDDVDSLAEALAPTKRVVVVATSDPERALVIVRGRPVRAKVAVASHIWLCLTSGDTRALLTFLLWLADPSFPTDAVEPPRTIVRTALSAYVPGTGWIEGVPCLDVTAFRSWLRRLARGQTEGTVVLFGFRQKLPSWAADVLRRIDLSAFVSRLPDDLVLVLAHGLDAVGPRRDVILRITEALDGVTRKYGVRTVAVFCESSFVKPVEILSELERRGKRVEVVVSVRAFTLDFPRPAEYAVIRLNVPIVQVVFPFTGDASMGLGEYATNRSGPFLEWTYQVQLGSEREGSFWYRVLWLNGRNDEPVLLPGTPDDLGRLIEHLLRLRLLPDREKRVAFVVYCYPPGRSELGAAYMDVPRSLARILARLAGEGFDLGPGTEFFRELYRAYREDPRKARTLEDVFVAVFDALSSAIDPHDPRRSVLLLANVGPWAKGELRRMFELYEGGRGEWSLSVDGREVRVEVRDGKVTVNFDGRSFVLCSVSRDQLIPVENVRKWFEEDVVRRLNAYLDLVRKMDPDRYEEAKAAVEEMIERFRKTWGDVTDNRGIMTDGRRYLIPALRFGNVAVVLQPVRGWSGSPELVYHSRKLPPHWQYIAAYEWLRRVFRADAVVYVGTHGTFEFLPGHNRGLTVTDWTHLLLPDVPQAYFYIVSNPGEGTLAKYRGGAVILTYPSPPSGYFKDFHRYAELERLWSQYVSSSAYGGNRAVQEVIARKILKEAEKLGILEDVVRSIFAERGESPPKDPKSWAERHLEEFLDALHDYLLSLRDEKVSYGLHVIGEDLPTDVAVDQAALLFAPKFAPYLAVTTGLTPKADLELFRRLADENPDFYQEVKVKTYELLRSIILKIWKDPFMRYVMLRWVELKDEGELEDNASLLSKADAILQRFKLYLLELYRSALSEIGLWEVTDQYDQNIVKLVAEAFREFVHVYRSGEYELDSLINFLRGGHVPTGGFGEPLWNPKAYPTGRNGVPFDPYTLPTPEAWEVAKRLVDDLLARYYKTHGRWPETVQVILFASHELTSGGLGIAEVLYLLGVKPVWDPDSGKVLGVRLIPLSELKVKIGDRWVNRPRIDVMALCTAVLDSMEPVVQLLAAAFRLASHADEPPEYNYRRKHYLELLRLGVPEPLAATGVFGEPPGDVQGTGVNRLVEMGWSELTKGLGVSEAGSVDERFAERIARMFESRVAYAFAVLGDRKGPELRREDLKGYEAAVKAVKVFRYLAGTTDVVIDQVVNAFNVIDVNDYYSWIGGAVTYVKSIRKKEPVVFLTVARDPTTAHVQTLAERLAIEVRTELLSPSWWKALMAHGPDVGWHEVMKRVQNIVGVAVTTGQSRPAVQALLTEVASTVLSALERYRPTTPRGWAEVQSTLSWLVEAVRVGLWRPSRDVLESLIRTWAEVTARYGPSTCHHTSLNPSTVPFVRNLAVSLNLSDVLRMLSDVVRAYQTLDNPGLVSEIIRMMKTPVKAAAWNTTGNPLNPIFRHVPSRRAAATHHAAMGQSSVSIRPSQLRHAMKSVRVMSALSRMVRVIRPSRTNLPPGNLTSRSIAKTSEVVSTVGAAFHGHPTAGSAVSIAGSPAGSTRESGSRASPSRSRAVKGSRMMVRESGTSVPAPRIIWEWVVGLLVSSVMAVLWARRWSRKWRW